MGKITMKEQQSVQAEQEQEVRREHFAESIMEAEREEGTKEIKKHSKKGKKKRIAEVTKESGLETRDKKPEPKQEVAADGVREIFVQDLS